MTDEERADLDDVRNNQPPEERLSTRAVAVGAAAAQAREPVTEPRQALDAQVEPKEGRPQAAAAPGPLFDPGAAEDFRSRWMAIQTRFVDEPKESVQAADELVALTMKRLAETFARERDNLEREWGKGDNVSTEDLRIALQRYRSFFDRLLAV